MKKLNNFGKLRFACFLMIFTVSGMNLFAQNKEISVKQLVNQKYYDELIKNGKIVITHDESSSNLELIPQSVYSSDIKGNLVEKQKKNFPFTYEALYYLPKKDLKKPEQVNIDKVSVACRSVSTMQGIKYYSTTRKKEVVLYDKVFTIANETSSTPVADDITGNANGKTIYCLQDDSSFGIIRFKIDYFQSNNEILSVFHNVDDVGIGPFRAIMPNKMIINLLVEDCGDSLLVYICADLDSKNFPGIKGQIIDSISSRMDSISKWFISQF